MASLGRSYLGESGVLHTRLSIGGGKVTVTVTDWLNFGDAPSGVLCCLVSPAPVAFELRLAPRPDFGRGAAVPVRLADKSFAIKNGGTVHASHPLTMTGEDILCSVPSGEEARPVLADDAPEPPPDLATLQRWRDLSLAAWDLIAGKW